MLDLRRRQFITLLGGASAWPLVARAQQGERVPRIGVLMNGTATEARLQSYVAAFVQGQMKLTEVIKAGGFTQVRRAAETPLNMILVERRS
jgi:hypothetical protein